MQDKDRTDDTGFTLEMPKVGVIKGVVAKDIEITGGRVVSLRTGARPYSNVYSVAQLRAIKNVTEKYGSNKVHLCPRHNFEIPEIRQKELNNALKELYIAGLFPGGAGASVRNIFTCPDWCSESLKPVQEIGKMVSVNFGDKDMPNKVTISFAGCPNACSRPHNCDIGIIAVGRLEVSEAKECPAECNDCIEVCRLQSIERRGNSVHINADCNNCSKCVNVCKYEVLSLKETGYRVLIGGKEGSTVLFGTEYAAFVQDFDVLDIIDKAIRSYKKHVQLRPGNRKKKERLADVIKRIGLKTFMED